MNETVEASVGCSGLFLVWLGFVLLAVQVPAISDFVRALPLGAYVLIVGLVLLSAALRNKR